MKELLMYIVKHLVDNPDEVSIVERKLDASTIYELRVASGDMGKVIGRHGRTAKDIRTLIRAAAARRGERATVEIMD
ncbi:MAG: KH domain-containing protein [Oscillospiraceae bacterium]|jgi:predicted RNA-binding protein YlqC (UPF0109 family)|nr:KH domain-containing protein [Oscillospiraceae bacterium]